MGSIWVASWLGQSVTGRIAFNAEQLDHHEAPVDWGVYLGSSDFWNRTLQNWQSEFLAADRDAARAAIGGYGAALELVDLGPVAGGSAGIVATNVFHRGVAFAPMTCAQMPGRVAGRLIVGGAVRDSAPARADYGELVRSVAVLLADAGSGCAPATC